MGTWAYLGARKLDVLSVMGHELKHGWSYAEHKRAGGPARLQATGRELTTGTLKIKLHHGKDAVQATIDDLKAAADSGEAQTLQRGDGRIVGTFVVTGLSEKHRSTFPDGQPIAVELNLELREWAGESSPARPPRPAVPGSPRARAPRPDRPRPADPGSVPAGKIVRRE